MSPVQEAAIRMIKSFPEDLTFDELLYRLYLHREIEEGLEAIESGDVYSEEEADRRIEEWLESFGPDQP